MASRVKLFLFLFLSVYTAAFCDYVCAQNDFNNKKFTTEQGLANNWVQSICQDKTGFLWIATWDGLSRYDGNDFKNYYSYTGNSASLPYFLIDKVFSDKFNNVIAFSRIRPVYIYNRSYDRFERFNINGDTTYYGCSDIAKDSQDNLWLICGNKLYFTDCATSRYKEIRVLDQNMQPYNLQNTPRIAPDNTGELWFYELSDSLTTFARATRLNDSVFMAIKIKSLAFNGYKSLVFHSTDCISFYKSKSGNTWMMSKYGLFSFDEKKNEFTRRTSRVNPEEFEGKPFFTWLDDNSGLNIIDTEKKVHYTINEGSGNYFEAVFIDRDKTIWAGSLNSSGEKTGLNRYVIPPDYFKHYLTEVGVSKGKNIILRQLKDKYGNIWATGKNYKYLLRIKPNGRVDKVNYLDNSTGKNFPMVNTMVEDSGGIWLGCSNNYLIYYNHSTGKFSPKISPRSIARYESSPMGIQKIIKQNNNIIIDGYAGLYIYNITDDKLELMFSYINSALYSFTLEADKVGDYWIGSHSGMVLHLSSSFKIDSIFRFGQRKEIVGDICPGDSDDLWVAFQGSGIGHIFKKTGKSESYTTANGLSNNVVNSILKDNSGNLWLATNKGISHFNVRTRQFRNFNRDDGLLIEEFNDKSRFITAEGEIFLGGVGGMVSFKPDDIVDHLPYNYPLIITGMEVSGIPRYFNKPVYESDTIILIKGDNNFHLTFACLDLKNSRNIKYKYRLIGSSDNWTETNQNNRNILFLNLRPGNYKLEMEATDLNGDWNSKTALVIIIPFRIFETLWFKILAALFAFAIIAGMGIIYIQQINLKAKQAQNELRQEALRAQMNPHFIFNSLNSINYYISKNDILSANNYIVDFSRLIRAFLTNLSGDYVLLETEIQMLKDYLNIEKMRFSNKFTYSINLNELEHSEGIQIFPGIVQPFIENAVWHGITAIEGRIGHISISFYSVSPRHIKCVIEDDGVGRKQTAKYHNMLTNKKSRGIGIVIERLHLINNRKKTNYNVLIEDLFPDREETGTRVTVDIPAKKMLTDE